MLETMAEASPAPPGAARDAMHRHSDSIAIIEFMRFLLFIFNAPFIFITAEYTSIPLLIDIF
jgi:hypothetical protein